jgi:hypothetical protein
VLLWVREVQRGLACVCAVLDLVPIEELRVKKVEVEYERLYIITLYLFLHFVEDKIKKLIVTLEYTRHFFFVCAFCCG